MGDVPCVEYLRSCQNKTVQSGVLKVPYHGHGSGSGKKQNVLCAVLGKFDSTIRVVSYANPPGNDILIWM